MVAILLLSAALAATSVSHRLDVVVLPRSDESVCILTDPEDHGPACLRAEVTIAPDVAPEALPIVEDRLLDEPSRDEPHRADVQQVGDTVVITITGE